MARDIARRRHADWLDSMVLLVAPIYNADGNERVSLTNRGPQHGPIGGMGIRANAQGLNINRDYMKLETPEGRSMVKLLNDYDPQVMMDLHTTDGSRHAYHLTYETPNNPAVDPAIVRPGGPAVDGGGRRQTVKSKYDWDFHAYGNVCGQPPERAWSTVEDLPRYSHNYWGLRNRIGILSETYSYATFQDRITARHAVRRGSAHLRARQRRGHRADDRDCRRPSARRPAPLAPVEAEAVRPDGRDPDGRDRGRGQSVLGPRHVSPARTCGRRSGCGSSRRSSRRSPSACPRPTTSRPQLTDAVERLRAHGIRLEPLAAVRRRCRSRSSRSSRRETTAQAFENHRERTVDGPVRAGRAHAAGRHVARAR